MAYIHKINQRTKLITIDFSYTKTKEDEAIISFYKQDGWKCKPLNKVQSKNASSKLENKIDESSLFLDIEKYSDAKEEARKVKKTYNDIKRGKGFFSARKYVLEWRNDKAKWKAVQSTVSTPLTEDE